MYKKILMLFAITAAATGVNNLASAEDSIFIKGAEVYTLSNLHPDPTKMRLYSTNYQLPGLLIERCTKITIKSIKKKKMIFTVPSGTEYTYLWQKYAIDPLPEHLKLFFGAECDASAPEKLSEIDQKGVKRGTPYVGMSKQGVLYALGYPPKHVNPDAETMDSWTYWSNKFNRFIVHFNDETGLVDEIQE